MKENSLPKSQEAQIFFDAMHEPHEICKWDKRRKCDSYYIALYNKEKEKNKKAVKILKDNKFTPMEDYSQIIKNY